MNGTYKEVYMPRGDRMGPDGMGPMTGRAAGICAGNGVPGCMNPQGGRGLGNGRGNGFGYGYGAGPGRGMGRGMGRAYAPGWQHSYAYAPPAPVTPEDEKKSLEREAAYIEEELKAIRKRLDNLDEKKS